jgi:hypothetical protein
MVFECLSFLHKQGHEKYVLDKLSRINDFGFLNLNTEANEKLQK